MQKLSFELELIKKVFTAKPEFKKVFTAKPEFKEQICKEHQQEYYTDELIGQLARLSGLRAKFISDNLTSIVTLK